MNNMSIKQIVLGGFMIVNLIIVALVGISYSGTSQAKEGFEQIEQGNNIAQEFAKTQQYLLTGIAYANYYFANQNQKDLQTYKRYSKKSQNSISNIIEAIKRNNFLANEIDSFNKIKSDLQRLHNHIVATPPPA